MSLHTVIHLVSLFHILFCKPSQYTCEVSVVVGFLKHSHRAISHVIFYISLHHSNLAREAKAIVMPWTGRASGAGLVMPWTGREAASMVGLLGTAARRGPSPDRGHGERIPPGWNARPSDSKPQHMWQRWQPKREARTVILYGALEQYVYGHTSA